MLMAGEEILDQNELVPAVRNNGAKRVLFVIRPQDVPYHCVGGAIFDLQRAGYEVTFAAEPPTD